MWLRVNPRSTAPMYQQVIEGIKTGVAKGIVKAGDRLPSVRELATELTINHNTIAKAYQELEREHVIEVVRGRGTFIALHPSVPNANERKAEMQAVMRKLLVDAHHLQLSEDDVRAMFEEVMAQWLTSKEDANDERGSGNTRTDEGV